MQKPLVDFAPDRAQLAALLSKINELKDEHAVLAGAHSRDNWLAHANVLFKTVLAPLDRGAVQASFVGIIELETQVSALAKVRSPMCCGTCHRGH